MPIEQLRRLLFLAKIRRGGKLSQKISISTLGSGAVIDVEQKK
jgi:hypothetical protein